jgi:hypothetical protein
MEVLNFKMTEQVKQNLDFTLKNKVQKADLEERLKTEFFRERNDLNPDDYTIEISFNKMANTYDIIIKKI